MTRVVHIHTKVKRLESHTPSLPAIIWTLSMNMFGQLSRKRSHLTLLYCHTAPLDDTTVYSENILLADNQTSVHRLYSDRNGTIDTTCF